MDKEQLTVEEFKEKKWEILFHFLDAQRDSVLDKEEFMVIPKRISQTDRESSGNRLTKIHEEYWHRMKDALGKDPTDDSFVVKEWIKAADIVFRTHWYQEKFIPDISQVYFDSVDTNHDGSISLDEWRKFQNIRGIYEESVIMFTFQKLDKDGDGQIDPAELRHGILQFGIGQDPSDDYSFLFTIATEA